MTVYFSLDRYKVDKDQKEQIAKVLPCLKKLTGNKKAVSVEGFACDMGNSKRNKFLAAERAKSVARYLRSEGVRVRVVKERSKAGSLSSDRKLNRKVEIYEPEKEESGKGR